jgi:Uma2 family endonuclease
VATTPTRTMTFEEFAQLPEPKEFRYELHHGELVEVTFPNHKHVRAQWQLRRLLEHAAGPSGFVDKEVPYRPLPEYEAWAADVAYMPLARWDHIEGCLFGAPDLVVEVLSPSNTASEMRDKRKLCLANGAVEFWIADPEQREVEVSTPDGRSVIYGAGQQIPLFFAAGSQVAVDAIFE